MAFLGRGACTLCDCERFRGRREFPSAVIVGPGAPPPDLSPPRSGVLCECQHLAEGHAVSWMSGPLLRLWPRGPVLLTRWAFVLVPLSFAFAGALSGGIFVRGAEDQLTPLAGDKTRIVQILVVIAISGFASPPVRKVYGLLGKVIRVAIVLLILYVIALLGVQAQWWEPFSVGPLNIGK
jgi:hypothetical protein